MLGHYQGMTVYYRHLPHIYELGQPVFVTWRLHGSLPANRFFSNRTLTSGQAFVAMDRLLDEARTGPRYLGQVGIADMVVGAIRYGAQELEHYTLHSWVVMSNHVHLLISPAIPLPKLLKSLKSITARRANEQLRLTGQPFWQEESYDHLVRNRDEFARIRRYIEANPVRAGLVSESTKFHWSSARATWGSPADQGVRLT